MRLAYCSPLPPDRSGIADYSGELLPYLAQHCEIELFAEAPEAASEALQVDLPVHPASSFLRSAASYDLALYQVGNHAGYHGWIHDLLTRHPGVVVMHEYVLHHLIQGLTLARGRGAPFIEEMRYSYGALGERLAHRQIDTGLPLDPWKYPLFERVVDCSLGVLAHNEATRRRVLASRPDTSIAVVPHHLAIDALPAGGGEAVRSRYDVPEQAFLVASFGFITPMKRLEVSLRAFAELRRQHPESRFLLAGEASPYNDLDSLLTGELGQGVTVTGRLDLPDLLAAMKACDVAINLRHPSGGETSGTLIRLLGLGKPVIVTDHGSFAEIPDGCCAKVALDESETALLAEYLRAFASNPELGRRLGDNARRHMRAHHSLEASARGYADFLERVVSDMSGPFAATVPLTRRATSTPELLISEVGAALADLGIVDDDLDALVPIAEAVAELGMDSHGAGLRR
jgi:glycosyltransferase involved in cell wall biosynthesis